MEVGSHLSYHALERGGAEFSCCINPVERPDPGGQSEEQRSCSGYRPIGPLTLSLHSEGRTHLLERDLDPPASQVPLDDLYRVGLSVGAHQRLSPHISKRVSDQYPPDVDGRSAPSVPDHSIGGELQSAFRSVLP